MSIRHLYLDQMLRSRTTFYTAFDILRTSSSVVVEYNIWERFLKYLEEETSDYFVCILTKEQIEGNEDKVNILKKYLYWEVPYLVTNWRYPNLSRRLYLFIIKGKGNASKS